MDMAYTNVENIREKVAEIVKTYTSRRTWKREKGRSV